MKITVWFIPTRQRFDNCLLKKIQLYVSAHTKAIVVGRQIDRKQFSLPGGRGSYPIGLNYRPII
jgi:hypothetical protein